MLLLIVEQIYWIFAQSGVLQREGNRASFQAGGVDEIQKGGLGGPGVVRL